MAFYFLLFTFTFLLLIFALVSFYPSKIQARLDSMQNAGIDEAVDAVGRSASFQCGAFVSFSLRVDPDSKTVVAISFRTNGCGYMIAAADVLVEIVKDRHLIDLHGLDDAELHSKIDRELSTFPPERRQCMEVCVDGLRSAFANFRARRIEEFRGEKALVCTCFGVTEETIERHIEANSILRVDQVTRLSNAGGGCGSCRMLIQEMIDRSEFQL